jgi:hypothetical protein
MVTATKLIEALDEFTQAFESDLDLSHDGSLRIGEGEQIVNLLQKLYQSREDFVAELSKF